MQHPQKALLGPPPDLLGGFSSSSSGSLSDASPRHQQISVPLSLDYDDEFPLPQVIPKQSAPGFAYGGPVPTADMKVLQDVAPQIASDAQNCLRLLRNQCNTVDYSRHPATQFFVDQLSIVATELEDSIKNMTITYADTRDLLDNIVRLLQYIKIRTWEISELGSLVKNLFDAIGDLATTLARMREIPVPDFTVLAWRVAQTCNYFPDPSALPSFMDYIPKWHDFEKVAFLGGGGFGKVYKVLYRPANFNCALKVVSKMNFDAVQESIVDKMVVSIISHPFLASYIASFDTENCYINIMEEFNGIEMISYVDKCRFLPLEETRIFSAQAYLAVEHLHLRGFLHRDLKHNNMVVLPGGRLKLFDYDLCRECLSHYLERVIPIYFRKTTVEFISGGSGTLPFMSPELLLRQPYGRATDWWSYGVCVFRMLNGKTPFRSNDLKIIENLIINSSPEWQNIQNVGGTVAFKHAVTFIEQLLEKKPERRLGSNSYDDIRNHLFFSSVDFDYVLRTTDDLLNSATLDNILSSRKTGHLKSIDEYLDSFGDEIFFKDVTPMRNKQHQRIFSYASRRFRSLMEGLNNKDVDPGLDYPSPPPSPLMDYQSRVDPFSIFINDQMDLVRTTETSGTISIKITRKTRMFTSGFGFTFKGITGAFSNTYHVVDHIKSDSGAAASQLIVGDIVAAIEGKNVVGLQHEHIMKFLRRFTNESLELEVFAFNPYRLIHEKKDINAYLSTFQQIQVPLKRLQKRSFFGGNNWGVEIRKCQVFEASRNDFRYIYLIGIVDNNIEYQSDCQLFFGDVVYQIESRVIDSVDIDVKQLLFKAAQDTMVLIIISASILRLHKEGPMEA